MRANTGRPGRLELSAVGVLFAAILIAVLVTYSRISPDLLYHVSGTGITGGLSRTLLELNFPDALIAVPLALVAVDAIRSPWAVVVAAVAIPACLVTALPGVVDQADLDAKPVNAIPAIGVGLTVALLVVAVRRLGTALPRLGGDVGRIVIAAALAVAAIPYWFAELGFYAPDPIRADEPTPGEHIASVHLGSHEGFNGTALALAVLVLSRLTPWFTAERLAAVTSVLLALLLAYGVGNLVQDDWHEQVVKRGWTDHTIPSLLRPQLSVGWALIVAAGVAIEVFWFRRERRSVPPRDPPTRAAGDRLSRPDASSPGDADLDAGAPRFCAGPRTPGRERRAPGHGADDRTVGSYMRSIIAPANAEVEISCAPSISRARS